jgi:hypothetical protein
MLEAPCSPSLVDEPMEQIHFVGYQTDDAFSSFFPVL